MKNGCQIITLLSEYPDTYDLQETDLKNIEKQGYSDNSNHFDKSYDVSEIPEDLPF